MKTWFMISVKFIPGSIIGSINYSLIHLFITYKLRACSGPEEHCAKKSIMSKKKTEAVSVSWNS